QEHVARLAPLEGTDDTVLGELVDETGRARVADTELALEERRGRPTFGGDRVRRLGEERIALGGVAGPGDLRLDGEDLLLVVGLPLHLPVADERVQLAITDEGPLEPPGLALVDREIEHVAASEQLLRAHLVEDHARVDAAGHREGDPARNVRLDEAGDDVRRRTLRGDDEVEADGSSKLRDPADEILDLPGRDH